MAPGAVTVGATKSDALADEAVVEDNVVAVDDVDALADVRARAQGKGVIEGCPRYLRVPSEGD